MNRPARALPPILCIALAIAACAGGSVPDGGAPGGALPAPTPPPAPWSAPPLTEAEAMGPYLAEWREAENRATCAPLAPETLGTARPATPRAATFAGGWAVAYDLPDLRSAFGVAGTGVTPSPDTYDDWPFQLAWADGSSAGYGPEGGSGPNQLAYLRVAGQACLYNVWSRLGREHLELLLSELRFVRVDDGAAVRNRRAPGAFGLATGALAEPVRATVVGSSFRVASGHRPS